MSATGVGTKDEGAIRDLIENWASAVRNKDIEGILAHHSPDILMFDVPPPLQSKGIEAYRKTWDLFFAWSPENPTFDIQTMNIVADDEVAFVTALMRCAGKTEHQSGLDFRLTVGLLKIGEQWVVAHEHHSIPAE